MGGNPAENHPCGFKWAIEAKKTRNAKLVVVDPRFTRTAAVADVYAQLRPGTDIAFLNGIIRYALETKRFHEEYVKLFTNAPYIISEKYGFNDGLFSGFDEGTRAATTSRPGRTSRTRRPTPTTSTSTLQHPRCVFQLLKKHVDRYTPEMVERMTGTPKETVPQGGEGGHLDRQRRASRHRHLRPRLDPALGRGPDDSRGGDAPAAPGERRSTGGRRQRAAWALQHPRSHRPRRDVRDSVRLPRDAAERAGRPGDLPGQGPAQDAQQRAVARR